ncbi:MAG: TlyA family RNA methyltransferase [Firmicutes bacterium]|nr:TlyA family RNA methyltransferase [Bacillota bacterium]
MTKNPTRKRVDLLLVERGLFPSREQAQRAILAGWVYADGRRLEKPGQAVPVDIPLEVRNKPRFVSRGGEKLAGALAAFPVEVTGRVCLDLGASTGGFTDCLLKHGARLVYAVDVGRGQLAWSLRQDPRVVVMEGVNARYLRPEDFPERPTLVTVDLSFISLRLVLPAMAAVLPAEGEVIALIKPQFEAGKQEVGKRGVVREATIHRAVLEAVLEEAARQGFGLAGLTHSPLLGPEGNIEFFAWWVKDGGGSPAPGLIQATVAAAHARLKAGHHL